MKSHSVSVFVSVWVCVLLATQPSCGEGEASREVTQRNVSIGDIDADLDVRVLSTCLDTPAWPVLREGEDVPLWDHPIPRRVFQIWFGKDRSRWQPHLDAWRDHALRMGMEYKLYTDDDLPLLVSLASPEIGQVLLDDYQGADLRGASDVARYIVLAALGGFYADADIRVPTFLGEAIELPRIFPMRGLVVVSDGQAVDWGTGGMHLLNGIMASCPHHPTIEALLAQIPANRQCCHQAGEYNPVIVSGPLPLNRLVTGPLTVVPTIFWDSLGVADTPWRLVPAPEDD